MRLEAALTGSLKEAMAEEIKAAVRAVTSAVRAAADAQYPPFDDSSRISLLVFGGSQGASLFSRIVPLAIAGLPQGLRQRLKVTQQVRDAEIADVRKAYGAAGVAAEIAPFFSDLPARMARSHLVIARAGASTVTELSTIGRPSVLAPLAIAMDDHQTGNARALSDAGAAIRISEAEFTVEAISARLHDMLTDPDFLHHMAGAAKGRVKANAAATLAGLVEEIAAEKARRGEKRFAA